jgi:hypothetical protein
MSIDTKGNTTWTWGLDLCFLRGFVLQVGSAFIRLRVVLPILCLDPCILALKCMNFTFRQPYPESKMKIFLVISIPFINLNPIDRRAGPLTNRVETKRKKCRQDYCRNHEVMRRLPASDDWAGCHVSMTKFSLPTSSSQRLGNPDSNQ